MKRLIVPAVLSLLLHGFLCAASVDHLIRPVVETPKVRVMSMDLCLIETPVKPEAPPAPAAPPDPVSNKTVRPKKVTPLEPITEKQTVPPPEPDPIPAPVAETDRALDEAADAQQAAAPKDIQPFQARVQQAFPLYQDNPPPDYPALARKRNWEGRVELDVLVGRDGRVMDLKVERSSGYSLLDRSALKSVSQWHFEPGKRGEERLDMWVKVPVVFRLEGA